MRACVSVNQKQIPNAQQQKTPFILLTTIDVQAQLVRAGLTVEQSSCRDLGPEMRNGDRSATINLINKPGINYRPGGKIKELPLSLRQAV